MHRPFNIFLSGKSVPLPPGCAVRGFPTCHIPETVKLRESLRQSRRVSHGTKVASYKRFASSAWLVVKTALCNELPCESIVTTAGKSATSSSQIASGEPNSSLK